jgi:translation initiation factor IF-2
MTSSKVRIYDLAKDLKIDSKRIIEEARREGVDVSVPSNSISKDLAEKIRNRHVPKKETVVARAIRVIKGGKKSSAEDADIHTTEAPSAEVEVTATAQAPMLEAETPPVAASDNVAPQASDPVVAARQTGSTPLVKRLAPAARAERPAATPEREAEAAPAQIEPQITEPSATNDTPAAAQATLQIPAAEVLSDARHKRRRRFNRRCTGGNACFQRRQRRTWQRGFSHCFRARAPVANQTNAAHDRGD